MTSSDYMLAVNDGVGGWAKRGVDVAKYSKQLMRFIKEEYANAPGESPKEILGKAAERCTETGSSTNVIAILEGSTLKTTNLGDSGYMLLRPDATKKELEVIHRSEEQQHRFNCPYQCGTNKKDPRTLAHDEIHEDMRIGDIIIMGSDGLFDNAHDSELLQIMHQYLNEKSGGEEKWGQVKSVRECSWWIARHASDNAFNDDY